MKEILRDRMFKSGSYRSHLEHTALYDALELSMDRKNKEEFKEATAKSPKRRHDDQDPPPPPPKDSDQIKKKMYDSDASDSKQPPIRKSKLVKADLKGQAYKLVRPFHTNSISLQFQMEECYLLLTDQIDLINPEGNRVMHDISKPLPLGGPQVRSYMRILSVVSLKTFSRYGYTYKISEADFENLHPNDFEDLYMLHLQGKLNHLYDYTIVHKPRAVIYRYRNNQKKMMRETEVHKFSDGMLIRILEKLDLMVKDFVLFKFNPRMDNRIWTEDDKRRSQEFIKLIERRLKIRRIFRSLESFVSGRLRDVTTDSSK
nr:hypothetical protein [Tanacetum cinerariifolium]